MARSTDLHAVRGRFLGALRNTLDLQLRLLHSTETDRAAIAREHDAFTALLDALRAHAQQPHVQRFSVWNQDEFVRAEIVYLSRFTDQLSERISRLQELLLIQVEGLGERRALDTLAREMTDDGRFGDSNQFTPTHRAIIERIGDPLDFYGEQIAATVFGSRAAGSDDGDPSAAESPGTAAPAGGAPGTGAPAGGEAAAEAPAMDETSRSLQRIKVGVIVDRLTRFRCSNAQALALALLKVKRWIAMNEESIRVESSSFPDAVLRTMSPGISVLSARPRDLLFAFRGATEVRALVHIGVIAQSLRDSSFESLLAGSPQAASASVVFVRGPSETVGSASVVGREPDGSLDELAALIKALEWSGEFMRLTSVVDPAADEANVAQEIETRVMQVAEEL